MAEENNNATEPISFTVSESKILLSIMKNLTGPLQFDADAVASECGFKSGSVLKTRWGQIRRAKLGGASPAGGVGKSSPNKKTPATPKKVKPEDDDEEGAATPAKTPTKRGGGRPKKVKKEDVEEAEEEMDGAQTVEKAEEAEVDELAG